MKRTFWFLLVLISVCEALNGQGLLNKIKNKANQEVNKLTNPRSSALGAQLNKNKLSSNVTRSVAVSLGSDEVFDYGENCIDLGETTGQISFIVMKRTGNASQCYSYRNGVRTPVACPTGGNSGCSTSLQCSYTQLRELEANHDEFHKYVSNEMESHAIQQPSISDQQMKAMAAYMTPAQLEEMKKNLAAAQKQTANQTYSTVKSSTINFNGKKYGPYQQVGRFFLSGDGKNFYAVVAESKSPNSPEVQNKMITSGSSVTLNFGDTDMPLSCIASPDNSAFGYVSLGMMGQKYVVALSTGKTYEMPFDGGFGGAWFSVTGNHLIFLSNSQLYFDGQVAKTFSNDELVKACDLYVGSDGKSVTVIKDNKISFADSDYFEYPLKISIVTISGKPYYKWLALENQEVVVYQKPY